MIFIASSGLISAVPQRITSTFDYPGHYTYPIEVVVKPNDALESLMEVEKGTEYRKMLMKGSGFSGVLDPNKEASYNLEYRIKKDSDLEKVKSAAFDGTLLVLDGPNNYL